MRAAVVTAFDTPPRHQEFPDPAPTPDETVVEVLAAGLHPRVRSQADGSHYTSTDQLPLIPGIDGVGRHDDGRLVYFVLPDTRFGAMAERVAIDARRSVELPEGTDPVLLAAAMNPAMSSWVALRRRVLVAHGQRVLVLGATGSAGRIAVQVAKRLGAAHVIAAGRNAGRLAGLTALGADALVDLGAHPGAVAHDLAAAGRDVDVVVDYLWGEPTAGALRAIIPTRTDHTQPLTWIQTGSVAGPDAPIPSAALRAARLQILGSGQGSVSTRDILTELPALAAEIGSGTFDVSARAVPLHAVEQAWTAAPTTSDRLVLVPGQG